MKKIVPFFFLAAVLASSVAHAGGLQSGTDAATTFKTWLFGFLGVVAFIFLMWKGGEAMASKIKWFDFLMAVGQVAVVGSVLGLTAWAWTIFA